MIDIWSNQKKKKKVCLIHFEFLRRDLINHFPYHNNILLNTSFIHFNSMPTATIDCSSVPDILNNNSSAQDDNNNLIFTPYGLMLLEIQGELNLPIEFPQGQPKTDEDREYLNNFITINEIHHAVKFGNLVFDEKDNSKVTLYVGKSQRLLGNVVKLSTPLAVLKIPLKNEDEMMIDNDDNANQQEEELIKLMDIVKAKVIFKQRPLPIM